MKHNFMHICFIYPGYPPEKHAGGIATYIEIMSHLLVKRGINVTVISRSNTFKNSHELVDGINLYRIGENNLAKKNKKFLFRSGGHIAHYKRILALVNKIDRVQPISFIECCDWGGEGLLLLEKYKNILSVKCHTPAFISESFNPNNNKYLSDEIKECEKECIRTAKKISSPSRSLVSELKKHIKINGKILIEPYLFDGYEIIQKSGYKVGKKLRILSVGRIEERKGQDIIMRSVDILVNQSKHVYLDLIGSDTLADSGTAGDYFLHQVSNQAKSKIRILGAMGRSEVLRNYKKYDLYIAASRFDNFPFTLLEAMAAGLPVIANNNSGMREIIKDQKNGLFFNGSARDLSKKILKLAGSEHLRKYLGTNAREYIIKNFSAGIILNKMIDNFFC